MLMKNALFQSLLVAIGATGISYLVGTAAGWVTTLNWLEVFAVFTSYACTYLCVKEKRINYPIGSLSTAAYCILFYQSNLLGSAAINALLAVYLVYGWFRWGKDDKTLPVRHVQARWIPVYLAVTGVTYLVLVFTVDRLGGTLAGWDVAILVGTILAQLLLDNKKIETWIVWVFVNVAAIYVYFSAGLALAGFQYIFFLANTIYGYYSWHKSMKQNKDEDALAYTTEPEDWDNFQTMLDNGNKR